MTNPPQSEHKVNVLPYMLAAVVATFGLTSAWSVYKPRTLATPMVDMTAQKSADDAEEVVEPVAKASSNHEDARSEPGKQAVALTVAAELATKAQAQEAGKKVAIPDAAPVKIEGAAVRATQDKQPAEKPASVKPAPVELPKEAKAQPAPKPVELPKAPATPKTVATPVENAVPPKPILVEQPATTLKVPPLPPTVPAVMATPKEKPVEPVAYPAPVREATKESPAPKAAEKPQPTSALSARPQVVASTADRAWVKLDSQRTVIVNVGEAVPGLGTYRGKTSAGPQFD